MSFCQYKNIFGKPNEGAHKYRLGPFAAVDLIGTFALAMMLCWLLNYPDSVSSVQLDQFVLVFLALLLLGESMHIMFCVSTPVTRALGVNLT